MAYMRKVIVVVGANASGKSSLAVKLAQLFNGEVISADSRQVYTGLNIATGKVTHEEMQGVLHHLIDIVDPSETYTAADFARDGRTALEGIFARGKLPIIAGGTGFYIDALLHPDLLASVPPNKDLRDDLEQKTAEELFAQLKSTDPERAADIHSKGEENLKRRIIRAIEVAASPTTHQTEQLVNLEILWLGLRWDNDVLKQRIHERTLSRVRDGMIEEATQLHADGLSWERFEELGLEYKHLADFLRERITHDELIERIDRDDWRYAKRQRTWFKRNQEITWFDNGNTEGIDELVEGFLKLS